MRVLITGATSYLGSHCASALSGQHEVRVLVPEDCDVSATVTRQAHQVFGDVTDQAVLRTAVKGCDAVIHARMLGGGASEQELEGVNVFGTENLLRAARAEHVGKVVYVSSYATLGPSHRDTVIDEQATPMGREWVDHAERTRTIADHIVRDASVRGYPVVMVYPTLLYGPGLDPAESWVMQYLLDLLQGRVAALLGDPHRRWNLAFGPDVASGIVRTLDYAHVGSRYILGGENIELGAVLSLIEEQSGVALPRWHFSDPTADWLLPLITPWLRLTGRTGHLDPPLLSALRNEWAFSSARAEAELGYRCRPVSSGLSESLNWLRESGRWEV